MVARFHKGLTSRGLLTYDGAIPLNEVTVRLVIGREVARWQTLKAQHHYLGLLGVVGGRASHDPSGTLYGSHHARGAVVRHSLFRSGSGESRGIAGPGHR